MSSISKSTTTFDTLNLLLTNEIKTILRREHENKNCVHLYGIGPYWAAFDRSAYLLEGMVGERGDTTVLRLKDYAFPLLMHSVHFQTVKELCSNHQMTNRSLEYLQFQTSPIDSESYKKWYREYAIDEY